MWSVSVSLFLAVPDQATRDVAADERTARKSLRAAGPDSTGPGAS